MKIVLAGGSGFLGQMLARDLAANAHDVVILSRENPTQPGPPAIRQVVWRPDGSAGEWASALDGSDAVVNLAGAGIADKRWTAARKQMLLTSRVQSTRSLLAAIDRVRARPAVFIQNCGIGYYGTARGSEPVDERDRPGNDFLARLCVDWEAAAAPIASLGCRLVYLRTGVVLAANGGALPKMTLPFRFFAGGPLGSGQQYLSWIHIEDWLSMMAWSLANGALSGPVNATSPSPVTNSDFSRAIGAALHRPSLLPVPGFVLKILVGELADAALLGGQRALPRSAQREGFVFKHPQVGEALRSLLS
ncbi:MAG: TIGR01777 family oxidoreductase [Vicinamibacterales bacterium]